MLLTTIDAVVLHFGTHHSIKVAQLTNLKL